MRLVSIIISCLMLVSCSSSYSELEKKAAQSAEQWLTIVDNGDYGKSWVECSAHFQSMVSQSDWVEMIGNTRQAFGRNLNRSLEKAEFTSTLPGAPDGDYVVATFNASFEQKASAIETVTVQLSDSEDWKVSGYFIR